MKAENMKVPSWPQLILRGDMAENLYQLGLKDQKELPILQQHIQSLLSPPQTVQGKILQNALRISAQAILKNHSDLKIMLLPYCEGLGQPLSQLLALFLIPEMLSSLHLFFPPLPLHLLGCSSFLLLDQQLGVPVHGRILDFPLVGTFEKLQRSVLYDFPQIPKIWTHSVAGLPLPALTSMNSEGLSLSIHQKFNKKLYPKGSLIFDLTWKILSECHNLSSVKKLLPHLKSLTTWGIYLTFKEGEAICLDISGEERHLRSFPLTPGKIHYFNNRPIEKASSQKNQMTLPFGIESYCEMRERSFQKKIAMAPQDMSWTEEHLLKVMGRPLIRKGIKSAKSWNQDVITFHTIASLILNPSKGNVSILPGPPPKLLSSKILKIEDIWSDYHPCKQRLAPIRVPPLHRSFTLGMRHLSKSTAHYDKKQLHEAYHHIQMSIHYFENFPEKYICEFYFLIFQYIHCNNKKEFPLFLKGFNDLRGKLPTYLEDHRRLFLTRLEKLVKNTQTHYTYSLNDIQHPALKKLFQFEQSLPNRILFFLRKLIYPQIGILDILYGYYR